MKKMMMKTLMKNLKKKMPDFRKEEIMPAKTQLLK
jgi:hypothetical protein